MPFSFEVWIKHLYLGSDESTCENVDCCYKLFCMFCDKNWIKLYLKL